MRKRGFNTQAIHGGHSSFKPDSMSVPIYQSVAYPYENAREAAQIFRGERPGYTYGRWDNPTVEAFEKRMAALEGAEGHRHVVRHGGDLPAHPSSGEGG